MRPSRDCHSRNVLSRTLQPLPAWPPEWFSRTVAPCRRDGSDVHRSHHTCRPPSSHGSRLGCPPPAGRSWRRCEYRHSHRRTRRGCGTSPAVEEGCGGANEYAGEGRTASREATRSGPSRRSVLLVQPCGSSVERNLYEKCVVRYPDCIEGRDDAGRRSGPSETPPRVVMLNSPIASPRTSISAVSRC